METKNFMRLVIPSLSENESFARVAVGSFLARMNPTLEQLADIKTVVSEAVTNAVVHGYENTIGEIEIECRVKERQFQMKITDYGKGIEDVAMARQPFFTTQEADERSGMGFTVMETFMDKLLVETKPGAGTTLWLEKHISMAGAGEKDNP